MTHQTQNKEQETSPRRGRYTIEKGLIPQLKATRDIHSAPTRRRKSWDEQATTVKKETLYQRTTQHRGEKSTPTEEVTTHVQNAKEYHRPKEEAEHQSKTKHKGKEEGHQKSEYWEAGSPRSHNSTKPPGTKDLLPSRQEQK